MRYQQGDLVKVHSIDNTGRTFNAKICGLSFNMGDSPATIYIVELEEPIDVTYKFSHATIPASCMEKR